jgi:hypothetical protein
MAHTAVNKSENGEKARRGLSLDTWSIILALVLSFLVWSGAITRVPW